MNESRAQQAARNEPLRIDSTGTRLSLIVIVNLSVPALCARTVNSGVRSLRIILGKLYPESYEARIVN